ncbi:hypothetical protein C8J57DRAFT_1466350 [Mycena rebaudengoi]|nr:hypothetical protein C8J57DRAFT_1466350 [Mycena rebaudengoi]
MPTHQKPSPASAKDPYQPALVRFNQILTTTIPVDPIPFTAGRCDQLRPPQPPGKKHSVIEIFLERPQDVYNVPTYPVGSIKGGQLFHGCNIWCSGAFVGFLTLIRFGECSRSRDRKNARSAGRGNDHVIGVSFKSNRLSSSATGPHTGTVTSYEHPRLTEPTSGTSNIGYSSTPPSSVFRTAAQYLEYRIRSLSSEPPLSTSSIGYSSYFITTLHPPLTTCKCEAYLAPPMSIPGPRDISGWGSTIEIPRLLDEIHDGFQEGLGPFSDSEAPFSSVVHTPCSNVGTPPVCHVFRFRSSDGFCPFGPTSSTQHTVDVTLVGNSCPQHVELFEIVEVWFARSLIQTLALGGFVGRRD